MQIIPPPIPGNILRGRTPTATLWDGQIGYAFQDDGGVFTDDTVDANDADAGDVALLPAVEAINDAFYFGENFSTSQPFNSLKLNISQAAVGGTLVWEYYNGAAWVALNPSTDETVLLTVSGSKYVKWTEPADWAHVAVNGQDRYWIRIRVTAANITTQPLATQIWLGRYPTSLSNITDGNISTKCGKGVAQLGASGNVGQINFDLGSARSVIFGLYLIGSASASTVSVTIYAGATLGATTVILNPSMSGFASAVDRMISVLSLGYRYLTVVFSAAGANTSYLEIYTASAYEVSL